MPQKKNLDFLDIIKKQRATKKTKKFEGTFLEYLEKVQENPDIVKTAHQRLCGTIESHGVNVLNDSDERCRKLFDGENLKIYDYFK